MPTLKDAKNVLGTVWIVRAKTNATNATLNFSYIVWQITHVTPSVLKDSGEIPTLKNVKSVMKHVEPGSSITTPGCPSAQMDSMVIPSLETA